MNNAAVNICLQDFVWTCVFISLGEKYLEQNCWVRIFAFEKRIHLESLYLLQRNECILKWWKLAM